ITTQATTRLSGMSLADGREFWSFKRPEEPKVPEAHVGDAWPRNEIDRFILARLTEKGLRASPQADRQTLLRRATFDLTGLPPTPEEVNAFVADPSPDAYDRLIDR